MVSQRFIFQIQAFAENRAPFSDHNYTRPWVMLCIFLAIVLPLKLLHSAENRAPHSYTNETDQDQKAGEEEELSGELDHSFEVGEQPGGPTATAGGGDTRQGACIYCGNLSTRRCSRCKAARYCSAECQVWHWRSRHKYECVGTETAGPVHGAFELLNTPQMESYGVEWNSDVREVDIYKEERQPNDESSDAVINYNGCAVCGDTGTTSCPRCKAVKYCSAKCLIEDWRWHKTQCIPVEENSSQAARPVNRNVGLTQNLYEDEDKVYSSGPLCLEFYPVAEGSTNIQPLIESSQEPTMNTHEHTVEWVRCLEEEVAKSRNEIILLQSERDKWEMRTKLAIKGFLSFKKEFEHQLFVLKNEKELISNAEKQARNVIHSLSERLHHLETVVQASIAEKRRLEEYIQMLESKCAQSKRELQEEQGRVQHLKETFLRVVTAAESRASVAEGKLHDLEKKPKSTDDKIVREGSLGKPLMVCAICLINEKDLAFGCGHMTCRDCGSKISKCPICREQITSHVRLYPG